MRLNPDQRDAVHAVRRSESRSFVDLARLAGRDPASDFVGANLRGIDFGTDDLAGFNFTRADVRNTNLARATGLHSVTWDNAIIDDTTLGWPLRQPTFDLDAVKRMILAGEAIPQDSCPLLTALDFGHDIQLVGLCSLDSLAELQHLDLRGSGVSDVSPMAGLTKLQQLYLSETRVRDLSPVSGLTALRYLDLSGTRIDDLSPLTDLPALRHHDLRATLVTETAVRNGGALASRASARFRFYSIYQQKGQ